MVRLIRTDTRGVTPRQHRVDILPMMKTVFSPIFIYKICFAHVFVMYLCTVPTEHVITCSWPLSPARTIQSVEKMPRTFLWKTCAWLSRVRSGTPTLLPPAPTLAVPVTRCSCCGVDPLLIFAHSPFATLRSGNTSWIGASTWLTLQQEVGATMEGPCAKNFHPHRRR